MQRGEGMEKKVGQLVVVDLYGCDFQLIDDCDYVLSSLSEFAQRYELSVIGKLKHRFSPYGVSAVLMIAESHISIHSWPEYNYVACDIFTCSNSLKASDVVEFFKEKFKATNFKVRCYQRSLPFLSPVKR